MLGMGLGTGVGGWGGQTPVQGLTPCPDCQGQEFLYAEGGAYMQK